MTQRYRSAGEPTALGEVHRRQHRLLAGRDVLDTAPSDGQRLVWDATAGRWKPAQQQLTATATWNPANMAADGNVVSTTITVTGAAVGDVCYASHDQIGANDVLVSAHVQAADTVRVLLQNKTGGALDIASGTLRVLVWKAS